MLTDLACAATLMPAYEPGSMERLPEAKNKPKAVIFIACGEFKNNLKEMEEYRKIV